MLRLLMTSALVGLVPAAAQAEDILLRADIAAATVYDSVAEVTRRATVTIPSGTHRLLIAMPDVGGADLIQVHGPEGLEIGPVDRLSNLPLPEAVFDTEAEAAARAALDFAEDAVTAAQDDIARADAEIRSFEAQAAYLAALSRGGEDGATMPEDTAALPALLTMLGSESARVAEELVAARIARRELEDALIDRQRDLAEAQEEFRNAQVFGETTAAVSVEVIAETAMDAEIELTYLTGGARWAPGYVLDLNSDTGALQIERFMNLSVNTEARWRDVAFTFSADTLRRQREPGAVFPTPARIHPEIRRAPEPVADAAVSQEVAGLTAMTANPMVMAEPEMRAALEVEGLSVRYVYTEPVSIGVNGRASLPFDALSLDTEIEARAVPRLDSTAFLVATGENDSGEPVLPGRALFLRDGTLVGEGDLPLIPQGAEVEMAFGALDHLRLIWIDRSLAEGDRGLFVTSNTQERRIAFGVENLGDTPETVRLIYATPFTEQEDLRMDLSLSEPPDERDVDDLRGVHAWSLDVGAGETRLIDMEVAFEWPEGQVLDWRP